MMDKSVMEIEEMGVLWFHVPHLRVARNERQLTGRERSKSRGEAQIALLALSQPLSDTGAIVAS